MGDKKIELIFGCRYQKVGWEVLGFISMQYQKLYVKTS